MKPKFYLSILLGSVLILGSCKSASKLYQQGRYDEAVELAAKKLAKKPNDASTLNILQNAYRFAVEDHERKIDNHANSNSDLRWESIYSEYASLQRLYDAIRRSPSVYNLVKPTDYSSFMLTYKEEASNARFDRGLEMMNQQSKEAYREAYYEFQKALELKPGDLAIRQKIDEAYNNAVTNVVIQPLNRQGYQYSSYQYEFSNFNQDVLRYLNSNSRSNFVKFYGGNDRGMRVDNVVDLGFSEANIGRYRDERNSREVSRQVVAKEIVIKPDSVVKEYVTVKAQITTITRTLLAEGILQATIRSHDNQFLWSDTYRSDYRWVATFASYTGDERALSEEDKRMVRQGEQWPPSNDEIIRVLMNDIQHKAQCGISDYYNRYN